ncbi:BZ3500_MvSof-1268-A1-R1_Chr9g10423 [Microbotryum saponariae]|uniref:BZ3500_MvSof-1268-A1-R1_Chr9g10423 protein n=1 Tax=Microbotryum saponariae TaxID=289078 RepID=A0A2X0L5F8_9BASI|nr:BZ3501_MvSof-1269-A2-R1_Chr9g10173 [Microbotryum saponariae]SDA00070.1 BZ3500_MvSof-1268-A1-R1_Chr9g10423 [Microbotryum saponariae]
MIFQLASWLRDLPLLPWARTRTKPIPHHQRRGLPCAKYLLWHYSQCVMTHIRAIAVAEPRPVHPVD